MLDTLLLKENAVPTVSCISEPFTIKKKQKQKSPRKKLPKELDHPYNTAECSTLQEVK